jgi:hypothetical protein
MFQGFDNPHEAETRQRWGDAAVDASYERLRTLSPADTDRARNGFTPVHAALAPLLAAGVPVGDERVQALIGEHHGVVSLFWTPDAAAYRGLGQLYVEDERFRQNIGGGNDHLVHYLRDGMEVYADRVLSRSSRCVGGAHDRGDRRPLVRLQGRVTRASADQPFILFVTVTLPFNP